MEDDLDLLIDGSLNEVETVLQDEHKPGKPEEETGTVGADAKVTSEEEAVRELQQGPASSDQDSLPGLFQDLMKSLQDENVQKALEGALTCGSSSSGGSTDSSGSTDALIQNLIKGFEDAVGSDENFAKSMASMMSQLIPNDVACEPVQQVAEKLESWLNSHSELPRSDRDRYEGQLRLYQKIVHVYKSNPDPLPEGPRAEIQSLVAELNNHGLPPDDVMKQVATNNESFEDLIKSIGTGEALTTADTDAIEQLADDPVALMKAMSDMARKLEGGESEEGDDEACKQQ